MIQRRAIALSIRRANVRDALSLSALMHASSAYHGDYGRILDGYSVTPVQIACDLIYLAESGQALVGFYSITLAGEPELDLMFVADGMQGAGVGQALFDHMHRIAAEHGIVEIKIVSHPPSVGFYQRMGAVLVGMKPPTKTAIWERPILRLAIGPLRMRDND